MPDNIELSFIDTNLWLYAFIESKDLTKSTVARKLISDSNIAVSVQVINEVCFNLIRKAKFSNEQIEKLIDSFFSNYLVIALDREILVTATQLRKHYSFSFWDSMIVAAALRANAKLLYSEDMQDGLIVEKKLRIVNPFAQQA